MNIFSLGLWFFWGFSLILSSYAFGKADPLVLSPQVMSFSGAADSVAVGTPISSSWSTESSVTTGFQCEKVGLAKCWVERVWAIPLLEKIAGISYYEGNLKFPVYRIPGVQGIGVAFALKDNNDAVNYTPIDIKDSSDVTIYPREGSIVNESVNRVSLKGKVIFVITGEHLVSGTYSIPYTRLANTGSVYKKSRWNDTSYLAINPFQINISARGCEVNTRALTYNMGDIFSHDLPNVGSVSRTVSHLIYLQCESNVHVFASMTDQSNITNNTSILSLTKDSSGAGVGVRFFFNEDSEPVVFGPDISSHGQSNQRDLNILTSSNKTYVLNLKSHYVRTGEIKFGRVSALASLTFSYQ
ncbi:TPA: fimbrial protein [Aeromonas hydrophila]|uniref:fimbrial protein n=1 Tax=Aeromonas hydrophila TaxID=644 RepID=UPI0028DAE095|nr:fimbrial protein [Aeromonas hydrophila]